MQVTETSSDGLKRELKVVVGQGELTQRFTTRLDEVKDQVQLKGFRKGKVPVAHIKKLYGRSVMAEVLQQAVEETSRKAIRSATSAPRISPTSTSPRTRTRSSGCLSGQSDLAFTMSYEALPEIKVDRSRRAEARARGGRRRDEAVDKAVGDLVERAIRYEVEADRAAGDGDRAHHRLRRPHRREEFEGGKGEDVQLVVGQSQFIPGFVEGIDRRQGRRGARRQRQVPRRLSGEDAGRQGRRLRRQGQGGGQADQARAQRRVRQDAGRARSLAKLRELVAAKIASEYASVARMKLKRQILDALDKAHDFALAARRW